MDRTACDFLYRGEAETVADELFRSIVDGKWHSMPNLAYRDETGKPVYNEMKTMISDLDSLPFYDKELFPNNTNSLFIISSRGCVMSCTYCYVGNYSRMVAPPKRDILRKRSVQNIIAEIKEGLAIKNYNEVLFLDDFFITSRQWMREFAEQYKREVNLPYRCEAFPATISLEIADLLADSGCVSVAMGFQTANEEYKRNVLKRKEPKAKIAKAVGLLTERGINFTLDHIFNLPGETKAQISESLDFYLDNKVRALGIYFMLYFPKTPISQYALDQGVITAEQKEKIDLNELIGEASYKGSIIDEEKAHLQVQIAMLFRLIGFLPGSLLRWMMKKDIYRFFPTNRYLYYTLSMLSLLRLQGINHIFILLHFFSPSKRWFRPSSPTHNPGTTSDD